MHDIEVKSDQIICRGVQLRASDIHIIPTKTHSLIQLRIDQRLVVIEKVTNNDAEKLISHFKFRSKMDIGERRRPQNGSLNVLVEGRQINLRFSTLPTSPHESLSIRILPQNEVVSLKSLALFQKHPIILSSLMKKANGLLLVSGPTGSGKTTTIYSLLLETLARNDKRVISIEDPIEKRTDAFIQVEINEKAGLTYAEALKAALRHDPDIIMIGEIRDEETAKIAVRAAMTGHLIVSTIHAKSCEECIYRLRELGIANIDIKETLVGLVSQRLVQLECPYCKQNCTSLCQSYRQSRRLAIFEILTGEALANVLNGKENNYERLQQLLSKGVALGYINQSEYERWL